MKSEIFVRFVSCVAKKVSCLKDIKKKKINDKGALLFALFILLAGGSRARQHRKDDHVIRGKQVAVFGRNIFTARNLSFEPSLDIPTPENYVLGSGDELIIDVWGASENTVREIISPEGTIHVAGIGPIFLSGMNIQDAERSLRREFSKIYAAIPQKTVHIELSLGRIRTIMINVMGEVKVPGIYRLAAFAAVCHALYRAGGISDIGSLRDIRVVRDGKEIARVDVYDYIMKGKLTDNIRLSEGDVILVPPYQNLVSISAGLAKCGKKPFACSPACFLSTRSYEQAKVDVAYSNTNVTLIGISGGISYGALGMSHHSAQDIAAMSAIPNMRVYLPSDRHQTKHLIEVLLKDEKPSYIRVGRNPVEDIYTEDNCPFEMDKATVLKEGTDVAIIACGEMVRPAFAAAKLLEEQGISATVLDMYCVKPLDAEGVVKAAKNAKAVITVEEHAPFGGLGSMVAQVVGAECPRKVLNMALPDAPVITGTSQEVFDYYGLNAEGIAKKAVEALK